MDGVRHNTSSALGGMFPYYAPYHTSDMSADNLLSQGEIVRDSGAERLAPAATSGQSDSVSISSQARRLYDASSSVSGPPPAALLGMPSENIALYNQIRRERDALPPGDPRIIELTGKLRAVLMAGEDALSQEDMHYVRRSEAVKQEAPEARANAPEALRTVEHGASASESKNRHMQQHTHDSADAPGAAAAPYVAPNATDTTVAAPLFAQASASSSRLHGYAASGTSESRSLGMSTSGRLYRVA